MMKRYTIIFTLLLLAAGVNAFAQPGQAVPNTQALTQRANQSQVFWHDGFWWGVFRHDSGSWRLFKYFGGWTPDYTFESNGSGKEFADAFIDSENDKLYIFFTKAGSGVGKFYRLTYSNNNWSTDTEAPLASNTSDNSVGCITRANDGDLFILYTSGDILRGHYSSNNGDSWTAFTVGSVDNGLVDAISFQQNGTDYLGVVVGENDKFPTFRFFKISDEDIPTSSSNWNEESLNFTYDGDNHVSMVKDFDQNVYFIGKYGSNKPTGSVFPLFRRNSANGNWSRFEVGAPSGSPTRPALSFDETNDLLYLFCNAGGQIYYTTLEKGNLHNISAGDWSVFMSASGASLAETSAPYQILTSGSDLLAVCENGTANDVWYRLLDLDYTHPDPLLISEVNSTANINASYLEIYNNSGSVVNLSDYSLKYYDNNSSCGAKRNGV